ncbi:aldo/keto reductase [Bacilli bacterium]|nr:aldo/keto reductase [Bacilli bacterium]
MEKLVNFRDLGGYQTLDSKKVRAGKVLRSAQPVGLADADKNTLLKNYQLKKIIDFRSQKEVAEKPVDTLTGVSYLNIDLMKDIPSGTASLEDLLKNPTIAEVDHALENVYGELVMDKTSQKGYANFLNQIIAQENGAVLFHCFAGKDRTGIGAALVLSLLGVCKADIVHDYLLTNRQRQVENQKMKTVAAAQGMTDEQLLALDRLLSVDEVYLNHAFANISKHYGIMQAYATEALDFEVDKQDYLRELLLAD